MWKRNNKIAILFLEITLNILSCPGKEAATSCQHHFSQSSNTKWPQRPEIQNFLFSLEFKKEEGRVEEVESALALSLSCYFF